MFVLKKDIPLFSGVASAWSEVKILSRFQDAGGQWLLNVKVVGGPVISGVSEDSVVEKKLKDPF